MDEGSLIAWPAYHDELPYPASVNARSPHFVMVSAAGPGETMGPVSAARLPTCRHLPKCRQPLVVTRLTPPRRNRAYTPCFRRMTGVCPDWRGSGTALAQTPSQQPRAQRRLQRAAGSLAGRLLPLSGGALGNTEGDRRSARPMVRLIPRRWWPVARGRWRVERAIEGLGDRAREAEERCTKSTSRRPGLKR
jgi:hypothetical protein